MVRLRSLLFNPVRLVVLWVGLALVRLGLIDANRARRTTALAWPRIVTGVAIRSKNAVDVALVGLAIGPAAIAGVGFAMAYWGIANAVGNGVIGGTIALVSQRFGADAHEELGNAIRASVLLTIALNLPLTVCFWFFPTELIGVLTDDPRALELGAEFLKIVGFSAPIFGFNLVTSRSLVGADDSWSPMVIRAGGAGVNIVFSALFIFGFGWGVVGAAWGTVLAHSVVAATFAVGLVRGSLPGIGTLPIQVDPRGLYTHRESLRQLIVIGLPVLGRMLVTRLAAFPMLAIVDMFGQTVVAAYIVARRIRDLMGTPGWGFRTASSSLVGQELGAGNETEAEAYGRDIIRFAVAVYLIFAAIVFLFAEQIVLAFVGDPTDPTVPIAVVFIYVACLAVLFNGVSSGASGPLSASGDTRWTFYARLVGYGLAIPVAYVGAVTSLGLYGLYLAFIVRGAGPAVVTYYRFASGEWKIVSRAYRPDAATGDD